MAAQTPIEHLAAPPGNQDDLVIARTTTPNTAQPQYAEPGLERRAAMPQARAATPLVPTAVVVGVGVAVLVSAALFTGGFLWRRLEPAVHRLLWRAQEIRVPLALPVTIAEIARELYEDKRATP